MGYAVGLAPSDMEAFCNSALLAIECEADVVVFTDAPFEPSNESACSEARLTLIPAATLWSGLKKDRYRIQWATAYCASKALTGVLRLLVKVFSVLFGAFDRSESIRYFFLHPALARYLLYTDFLEANLNSYDRVMIADVRDVYFQGDPFSEIDEEFVTFLEPEGVTCGEKRNNRWIKAVYGRKMAEAMKTERTVCSGVSVGSSVGMLTYLRRMREELVLRGGIPYSDQGIHNVLLRKLGFEGLIKSNSDSYVLTAGAESGVKDFTIQNGLVCGNGGVPFSVIHQYDRHPHLDEAVKTHYELRSRRPVGSGS